MKKFKDYIIEDIKILPMSGIREMPEDAQDDFKLTPKDFDKPVHSIRDYDIYQLHHGYGSHKGFGNFVDITNKPSKYTTEGGRFGIFHRPTGQIAGYIRYHMNPHTKEVEIKDLKGVEGHKNIRSMLYDTITDHLGYTLLSDSSQSERGMRGWKEDIHNGENIKVRYHHEFEDEPHEVAAHKVPENHIWSKQAVPSPLNSKILVPPENIQLVRYPKHKY